MLMFKKPNINTSLTSAPSSSSLNWSTYTLKLSMTHNGFTCFCTEAISSFQLLLLKSLFEERSTLKGFSPHPAFTASLIYCTCCIFSLGVGGKHFSWMTLNYFLVFGAGEILLVQNNHLSKTWWGYICKFQKIRLWTWLHVFPFWKVM